MIEIKISAQTSTVDTCREYYLCIFPTNGQVFQMFLFSVSERFYRKDYEGVLDWCNTNVHTYNGYSVSFVCAHYIHRQSEFIPCAFLNLRAVKKFGSILRLPFETSLSIINEDWRKIIDNDECKIKFNWKRIELIELFDRINICLLRALFSSFFSLGFPLIF